MTDDIERVLTIAADLVAELEETGTTDPDDA